MVDVPNKVISIPLVVNDMPSDDARDTVIYLSTYRLRRSYEFVRMLGNDPIHANDLAPHGDHIVLRCGPPKVFVEHFWHLMKVSDLRAICIEHGIELKGSDNKQIVVLALSTHTCTPACVSTHIIVKTCRRDRTDAKKRDIPTRNDADVRQQSENLRMSNKLRQQNKRRNESDERRAINHDVNLQQHRNARENSNASRNALNDDLFPPHISGETKGKIILDWQEKMDPKNHLRSPCAVCAHEYSKDLLVSVSADNIDLTLLQNSELPTETRPTTYNFIEYKEAILLPEALEHKDARGKINVCRSCLSALEDGRQPLDSLANFQYYARDELPAQVKDAFQHASPFEIMMTARARATKITYLFSKKKGSPEYGRASETSQGYSKGNVAILPQDALSIRRVLPPTGDEIEKAMAVLFIGTNTKPTADNIERLRPVLVSKSRVKEMIEFLVANNYWYRKDEVELSEENLDGLYNSGNDRLGMHIPASVELCYLTEAESKAAEYGTSGYTDRDEVSDVEADSELLMDAVGYAAGDHTPQNYLAMKASAVAWCLDKKRFVRLQSGSSAVNESDPSLLSSLFPHLDPWGIGSFREPRRRPEQRISFERQVRNLLLQYNSPFKSDPTFAFVCWNIIQKKEVNKQVCFKTRVSTQQLLAKSLKEIAPQLTDLSRKWEVDPHAKPSTVPEKQAMRLLNQLKMTAKDVKGSSGYKLCRRNEIRALIRKKSTPALFLTLNPSDVHNPLIAAMAGIDPTDWASKTKNERAAFVAANPATAAIFFDVIINAFVDVILRYGKKGGGLFGECEAYYGMVEAQGRGTLHLHMLIWIKGNPSPQELRDRMSASPSFQQEVFSWVESIIHCELPGTDRIVQEEPGHPLTRPNLLEGQIDPRLMMPPILSHPEGFDRDPFVTQFRAFVKELAIRCNWHQHTLTCWKHLRPGEPRDDAHCRMRINGSTRALTELDHETQSILLRRLHPRINNFNELVIFLCKCNMDIKYIGSGEAAKALVFYVTDYVTKSTLATHVGLSALIYAVKQNEIKYLDDRDTTPEEERRSLFVKMVNSMMARQELSHQQVMSYLVGGGDHYKSHNFKVVRWCDFDRYVREKSEMPQVSDIDRQIAYVSPDSVGTSEDLNRFESDTIESSELEDNNADTFSEIEDDNLVPTSDIVTMQFTEDDTTMIGSNDILDYIYRSSEDEFEKLSIWQYTESVIKITKNHDQKRVDRNNINDEARQHEDAGRERMPRKRRGRHALARGSYAKEHPQHKTHISRLRDYPVVPVLLGDSLPRPDRKDDKERWCRAMLIIFKPWREVTDIKGGSRTWCEAFDKFKFSSEVWEVIKNMNVENECRDAREMFDRQRKSGARSESLMDGFLNLGTPPDIGSLGVALMNDDQIAEDEDSIEEAFQDSTIVSTDAENTIRSENDAVVAAGLAGLFDVENDVMYPEKKKYGPYVQQVQCHTC